SVLEPRMLSVQVWDRSQVNAVVRAIGESNLGLNPMVEGTSLRIPIPELNEERRRELAKVAHKYSEQARIAVRNVRREAMDRLKRMDKEERMSQDENRFCSDDVQKLTDGMIKEIDELLNTKEAEIMQF
ncbi:MAG: ribosome-recycling factor, partial [Alphaproteobacteria bacterium]|nr:ribosome-recycling factor [Alphaproteobacteria bacterium]